MMQKKVCLIMATLQEAEVLCREMQLVSTVPFSVYESDSAILCIIGMGEANAKAAIPFLLQLEVEEYWNVGICGCLRDEISLFEICLPAFVMHENAQNKLRLLPEQLTQDRKLTLITVAQPVHGGVKRHALAVKADLVDMEGFLLADAFLPYSRKFMMLKCVSDYCQEGGSVLIRQNLPKAANILFSAVKENVFNEKG